MKIKVYNAGSNELPAESTPFSAAKDIRVNIKLVNSSLIYGGYITSVGKDVQTGYDNPDDIEEEANKLALILHPNGRALIPSGLYMEIPNGYSLDVRPRSGLALKYGIEIVNSPGLIDPDYRGDVGIIIKNGGNKTIIIVDGERVAQVKLVKDVPFEWESVESKENLLPTVRGEGGFNHTGTN